MYNMPAVCQKRESRYVGARLYMVYWDCVEVLTSMSVTK